MAIRRNVRLRKITAAEALDFVMRRNSAPSAKIVRWLEGRIAWATGRKRTGQ